MGVRRCVTVALVVGVAGCAAPVTGTGISVEQTSVTTAPASPPADAIRDWEAAAGEHFGQSARALEKVAAAADKGDDAAVREGCAVLHDTNAIGLQQHLPTPDPALTAELQRMIDDMNAATHACLRFLEHRDATDATVYQDYLARAVEHLDRAKVILDADRGGR